MNIAEIEQTRDWQLLIGQIYHGNLVEQEQSRLMRAYAYLGQYEQFEAINRQYRRVDTINEIRFRLARTTYYRRKSDFHKALININRAYLLAKEYARDLYYFDACFERAMVLTEMGHLFEALGMFQRITGGKNVSPKIMKMSLLNQGLLLWDMGQHFHLKKMIKERKEDLPTEYLLRMNILCAMADLDHKTLMTLFSDKEISSLNDYQKINLSFLFLEWAFVAGKDKKVLSGFYLYKYLRHLDSDHNHYLLKLILEAGFEKGPLVDSAVTEQLNWRDQIDYLFLLSLLNYRRGKLGDTYKKLLTLSEENCISTPLMPRNAVVATSPWQLFIVEHILNDKKVQTNSQTCTLLYSDLLLSVDDKRIISLKRRPIVVKLVELLIEKGLEPISKEEIHMALTGNKYNASLHDGRLYKVISRFNKMIIEKFGIKVLEKRRDNYIYPLIKIERKK